MGMHGAIYGPLTHRTMQALGHRARNRPPDIRRTLSLNCSSCLLTSGSFLSGQALRSGTCMGTSSSDPSGPRHNIMHPTHHQRVQQVFCVLFQCMTSHSDKIPCALVHAAIMRGGGEGRAQTDHRSPLDLRSECKRISPQESLPEIASPRLWRHRGP